MNIEDEKKEFFFLMSRLVPLWHCNVQIDIGIRADELGISIQFIYSNRESRCEYVLQLQYAINYKINFAMNYAMQWCNCYVDIAIRVDELGIRQPSCAYIQFASKLTIQNDSMLSYTRVLL
jgi:hypothetical protein